MTFEYATLAERLVGDASSIVAVRSGHPAWRPLASLLGALVSERELRIVGISGSQGSGKSSLAATLVDAVASAHVAVGSEHSSGAPRAAATASLDDFYLTHKARERLAAEVHPLLQTRGVPGTHETELMERFLAAARAGTACRVPEFDKGQDDRVGIRELHAHHWVFEGWCLGAQPQAGAQLTEAVNALEREEDTDGRWRSWVNRQLQGYQPFWEQIDFWVHLRVPGFAQVEAWRYQQELALAPTLRMSRQEIRRFIAHYERVTRALWAAQPQGPGLVVTLDAQHHITSVDVVEG
ncbi:MAG: kinase [Pseudomonadota bacterium]